MVMVHVLQRTHASAQAPTRVQLATQYSVMVLPLQIQALFVQVMVLAPVQTSVIAKPVGMVQLIVPILFAMVSPLQVQMFAPMVLVSALRPILVSANKTILVQLAQYPYVTVLMHSKLQQYALVMVPVLQTIHAHVALVGLVLIANLLVASHY